MAIIGNDTSLIGAFSYYVGVYTSRFTLILIFDVSLHKTVHIVLGRTILDMVGNSQDVKTVSPRLAYTIYRIYLTVGVDCMGVQTCGIDNVVAKMSANYNNFIFFRWLCLDKGTFFSHENKKREIF